MANRTPSRGQELAGTKRATEDQHGGGKDREVFKKRSIHGMEVANAASGTGSGVGCGVGLLGVGSGVGSGVMCGHPCRSRQQALHFIVPPLECRPHLFHSLDDRCPSFTQGADDA